MDYANRLEEQVNLLRIFLRALVGSRLYSYGRISDESGVPKSQLHYLLSAKEGGMKMATYTLLLRWFQKVDFPSNHALTAPIRHAARALQDSLAEDSENLLFKKYFPYDDHDDRKSILKLLEGYFLCYRFRGTRDRISVSYSRFHGEGNNSFVSWRMKYRNTDAHEDPDIDEFTDIHGFVSKEDHVFFCNGIVLGKNGSHSLKILESPISDGVYCGLFSSYSKEDPIAAKMLLVRREGVRTAAEIDNLIGDKPIDVVRNELDDFSFLYATENDQQRGHIAIKR